MDDESRRVRQAISFKPYRTVFIVLVISEQSP